MPMQETIMFVLCIQHNDANSPHIGVILSWVAMSVISIHGPSLQTVKSKVYAHDM